MRACDMMGCGYGKEGKEFFHSSQSLNIVCEEKCLLWTGEVQDSRMPFWEKRGLPPSSMDVMMRTAVIHFISSSMGLPYTILPHHRAIPDQTQTFIIKPVHICHPTLKPHTPPLGWRPPTIGSFSDCVPGTVVWTVCLIKCVTLLRNHDVCRSHVPRTRLPTVYRSTVLTMITISTSW